MLKIAGTKLKGKRKSLTEGRIGTHSFVEKNTVRKKVGRGGKRKTGLEDKKTLIIHTPLKRKSPCLPNRIWRDGVGGGERCGGGGKKIVRISIIHRSV